MSILRIAPKEAHDYVANRGFEFLDVRSIPEYQGGHPQGAYNIPLMHMGPGGMAPNPTFVNDVAKLFPEKSVKLVIGCKSGGRSLRAAELLATLGYSQVVDMRGGYHGDGAEAGWLEVGLPTETATSGRSYEELKK